MDLIQNGNAPVVKNLFGVAKKVWVMVGIYSVGFWGFWQNRFIFENGTIELLCRIGYSVVIRKCHTPFLQMFDNIVLHRESVVKYGDLFAKTG